MSDLTFREREWLRQMPSIAAKFDDQRARLEAAEAVARRAVAFFAYLDRAGWNTASLSPLRETVAAWERSQETGQP